MTYSPNTQGKFWQRLLRFLLLPASLCFHAVVIIRHFLYEKRILKVHKCGVPVVSVGNIVAGGSGKTPFTLLLAKRLISSFPIAIVSRGYRGKATLRNDPLVVSKGLGPETTPEICGDEPYMLSQNLPEAIVVVGRDRAKAISVAEKMGAKLVILDDGMQHRRVHRDIEIVLLKESDLRSSYLPAGFLRETPKRLKSADMIVLPDIVNTKSKDLSEKLSAMTSAKVVELEHAVKGIVFLNPLEKINLKGKAVGIFCGIAHPNNFRQTVESMGMKVVATHYLKDHGTMSAKNLEKFATLAQKKGAVAILCTEKDHVKIEKQPLTLPLAWVQRESKVSSEGSFDALVEEIKSRCL